MIHLNQVKARTRAIADAINREGAPCPTFARASQNMAAVAALQDTLPASFTEGVDKVYHQLKDILGAATAQQVERAYFSGRLRFRPRAQAAPRPADQGPLQSPLRLGLHPRQHRF
jgi:hypothetical protein